MDNKRQSVFMQMHNGTRGLEGSFNIALTDLFYKADQSNRCKLVAAFPEFFGDEVLEFGIPKYMLPAPPPVAIDLEDVIEEYESILRGRKTISVSKSIYWLHGAFNRVISRKNNKLK